LIHKYIDYVEIEKVKDEIIIKNINIKKTELENIGYMFRSDCLDMILNVNERDIILSNYKTTSEIDSYVNALSEFYKVSKKNVDKELLNIDDLLSDNVVQVIPNKKENKFDKEVYTILQVA